MTTQLSDQSIRSMMTKRPLEDPQSDAMELEDSTTAPPQRHTLVTSLLARPSPFANETGPLPCGEFEPSSTPDSLTTRSSKQQVLVVGAGGLGCEILKDLALSQIVRTVHVIDLDAIDVTNLNRQFLFRRENVGQSKAVTAARFIQHRCPWMTVIPHYGKIQDQELDFYRQFDVVISGLDNIEARRWLNATIVGLVQHDDDGDIDPSTIIPIVDGGTEGFQGQARLILPKLTSCFECTLDSFPPQTAFPLCTIAETPRRPEHCIAYAYILQWPREFPDTALDKDSPEHMQWVYQHALERAQQHQIEGVTYSLTMGVVKNIIPAVASTNAIIAAACVHEAIKYLTFCSQSMHSYLMYMGGQSIHTHTFHYEPKQDCPVCSNVVRKVTVSRTVTLNEFIQTQLKDSALRLQSPSLVTATGRTLYMVKPMALEKATRKHLDMPLSQLIAVGDEITITDPTLQGIHVTMAVSFD